MEAERNNMLRFPSLKVTALLTVVSALAPVAHAEWVIQALPLGATAVSGDGSTIVTGSHIWRAQTGLQSLGDLPGGAVLTQGLGVSFDGQVVVGKSSSGSSGSARAEAFRWTHATGIVGLGDLAGGPFDSVANATSDDGSVIVGRGVDGLTTRATRWTPGTGTQSLVGGQYSEALGVSRDGAVVVGHQASVAFRWDGVFQSLGVLPGDTASRAYLVSADNTKITGVTIDNAGFFEWTAASGMVSLGSGGYGVHLTGRTADGNLITYSNQYPYPEALIRYGGGTSQAYVSNWLRTQPFIGLDGWVFQTVAGISADGHTLAGIGVGPGGRATGWLARWDPVDRRDVTGTIAFSDFDPGAPKPSPVDFWFVSEAGGTELGAQGGIQPDGSFHITAPSPVGRYWLYAKPTHWLTKRVLIDTSLGSITDISLEVINGDCDGDNEVGIGDYAILSGAYNSGPGDLEWNANADLNGDESVDIADYAILSANDGRTGDS